MAAYAALVSLMNDLELIPNHPIHSFSFDHKQISSLSQTVNFLVDFMESYDTHGCSREAAEVLESRIASAAHAAHDVVESHVVDQIHSGSTLGGKSRSYFLLDLQKAIDNIYFIKKKAAQLKAKSGLTAELLPSSSAPTSSHLTSEKNVMVGFDAFVSQLMEMVIGGSSRQRVIPIVGMGGMGKTTLAKNVYDSSFIKQRFDIRLWATISQEFSVENILTQLLSEKKTSTCGNVCELGEELHKMLCGRRYFIVLDDMWSEGAWDKIRILLPDDGNGSRVIVTTRLSNLAAHLSSSPFEMSFLDEDKSWQLFRGNAFAEGGCPVELEKIGKKIVKRCGGLPLSIVVIAGHLRRSSRAIEYWEKVANFMNPISSSVEDEQCLNIIRLSYGHLPVHLKPCFLYMGIFKEDEVISASQLFNFWVAEGFLKAEKGVSLEEIAEDYLKDLIDRNLILVRRRWWNGKVKWCGVHDIVRELCLKVAKKEKFIGCRERRIVIPDGKKNSSYMIELRLLRVSTNVNHVFLKKGCPYAFDAHFQQLNLRYLTFHFPKPARSFFLCYIPSSIPLFWNMQTLTVYNYSHGKQLIVPYEIWEMPQLRHLKLVEGGCLPDPILDDYEISNREECIVLRNLHTLEVENLRLTEAVCKRMPNIKVLYISYNNFYDDFEAISYYCPHNLCRFNKLESLRIQFDVDSKWRDVVRSFTFPTSLEELSLHNCHLDWGELTMMIKSLPHLGSLQLTSIKGTEWNLVDEEFSHLKELRIGLCDDWIYWNADSSHFPVLESLYIWDTIKLSEIPLDFGEIPTLVQIGLRYCSVSVVTSAMKIVMEQESFGNHDLRLAVDDKEMEQVEIFQKMVLEQGGSNIQ